MNTNRYVMASVAAGVFIFLYGFIVNAILLADFWMGAVPAGMFRPDGGVIMWALIVSCLLQGFVLGYIFLENYEGKGLMEGARFGFLIALFMATIGLLNHGIMPVPLSTAFVSVIADGLGFVGLGAVFAMVYKPNA